MGESEDPIDKSNRKLAFVETPFQKKKKPKEIGRGKVSTRRTTGKNQVPWAASSRVPYAGSAPVARVLPFPSVPRLGRAYTEARRRAGRGVVPREGTKVSVSAAWPFSRFGHAGSSHMTRTW